MILTVDLNASTKLTPGMSVKLTKSNTLMHLSDESRALAKRLKAKYGFVKHSPTNDPALQSKKEADAALHHAKTNKRYRLPEKARERHFLNADTNIIEAQSGADALDDNPKPPPPLQYAIPEPGDLVWLTCESHDSATDVEKHNRRIESIHFNQGWRGDHIYDEFHRHVRRTLGSPGKDLQSLWIRYAG